MKNITKPKRRFKGYNEMWVQRKLGDMMDVTSVKRIHQSDWTSSGVRFLRARDIVAESKNEEVTEPLFISQEKYNEYSAISGKVKIGDLLVTGVGTIGVPMLIKDDEPLYFKDGNIIWFKNDKIDGKFFYYSFIGNSIQNYIKESAGIGTVGTYTIDSGKNTPIVLPTQKNEQKKIGEYLSHLDNLISLHQRKYEKLQSLKKAYLSEMFPLPGEKRPRRRFAGFTGDWEQRKVGEITSVLSGSRVHKDDWTANGVPFYRSSDVVSAYKGTQNEKAFISQELFESLAAISGKLEKEDILITGGGSIGIPYIVPDNKPLYTKDADLIWVKKSTNHDSKYLYTYFESKSFREYLSSISHTGTISHYTIEQVKATPVSMPVLEEQKKIGEFFADMDNLITLHQRKLAKLQALKQAYLTEMFV